MTIVQPAPAAATAAPYTDDEIARRVGTCPKLASLHSVNSALGELVRSDRSQNSQIAEIIRRDASLSARLLRMVNSVYFGLSTRVNNIEEAVFFLGLRQIRELALSTPVIDEMERLQQNVSVVLPWKELWRHSLASAILTRELIALTSTYVDDDTDYLVGLLHNVGKVVMAHAFPVELGLLLGKSVAHPEDFARHERELIGWDHARIGAHYLQRHQLSEEIVTAIMYHNDPEAAPQHQIFAAAVQVADHLVRHDGMSGGFEQVAPIAPQSWLSLPGWKILYGDDNGQSATANSTIAGTLERLPAMLEGLL